jgi:PadR family transcriptional regulator PadR
MAGIDTQTALLQALIEGPSFGLALIDKVSERTRGKLVLHQGNVYPALREMERDGLLRSYEGDPTPERGGRPRRYYELTAKGRRAADSDRDVAAGLFGLLPEGA